MDEHNINAIKTTAFLPAAPEEKRVSDWFILQRGLLRYFNAALGRARLYRVDSLKNPALCSKNTE